MLSQSLGVPGAYTICFSVYVRSDSAGMIGILRDATRINLPVGPQWKRIQIGGSKRERRHAVDVLPGDSCGEHGACFWPSGGGAALALALPAHGGCIGNSRGNPLQR